MELQDPMVAFSIFASVTITRAGTFTSLADGLGFISRLLKGFMIGFAVATGVSLLILPITSRGDVFHDIKGYVTAVEGVLQTQISFVEDSSATGLLMGRSLLRRSRTAMSTRNMQIEGEPDVVESKQKHLQASMAKLTGLHSKLHADLFYSKDEIAWGKLSAEDLSVIASLLRSVLLPLSGMSMLPEILETIIKNEGPHDSYADDDDDDHHHGDSGVDGEGSRKYSEIQKVAQTLHERLLSSSGLVKLGLHYFLLSLELIKPKHLDTQKKTRKGGVQVKDEEARGETLSPLEPHFVERYEHELRNYYSRWKHLPEALASLEAFSASEKPIPTQSGSRMIAVDRDVRQEFFLLLYMDHLQADLLNATLQLVQFAASKIADGTMKHGRLIFPRQKSIREWFSLSTDKKAADAESDRRQPLHVDPSTVQRSQHDAVFPDPEHLHPANVFEKLSVGLRVVSHAIKSEQSSFGFRVAAASFSVGILAFLHQTQDFFIRQRCIWAMIVIVIGMNPTSGQTMFGFVARIVATAISLVLSLIVWYIVDGKTAGVIIFLYLANVFEVCTPTRLYDIHLLTISSITFMSRCRNTLAPLSLPSSP